MTCLECSFRSRALLVPTTIHVILPYPPFDLLSETHFEEVYQIGTKFKTLYLFHGACSDATMWLHAFNVEYWAEKYQVAIVMPSVGNSFYTDLVHGPAYWTYVSEELPRYVRSILPLSPRREDNFVAGISMGGYGALKLVLNRPDQYTAGICLSGALDIVSIMQKPIHPSFNVETYFGGFERLIGSDNDLYALIPKLTNRGISLPKLYMACGVDDELYDMSIRFRDLANEHGIDLTYEEGPGAHTWEFWNEYFPRALEWLDRNFIQEKRTH